MSFWMKSTLVPWSPGRRKALWYCVDLPVRRSNGETSIGACWGAQVEEGWPSVPEFRAKDTDGVFSWVGGCHGSQQRSLVMRAWWESALPEEGDCKLEVPERHCLKWTHKRTLGKKESAFGWLPHGGHRAKWHYQSSKVLLAPPASHPTSFLSLVPEEYEAKLWGEGWGKDQDNGRLTEIKFSPKFTFILGKEEALNGRKDQSAYFYGELTLGCLMRFSRHQKDLVELQGLSRTGKEKLDTFFF